MGKNINNPPPPQNQDQWYVLKNSQTHQQMLLLVADSWSQCNIVIFLFFHTYSGYILFICFCFELCEGDSVLIVSKGQHFIWFSFLFYFLFCCSDVKWEIPRSHWPLCLNSWFYSICGCGAIVVHLRAVRRIENGPLFAAASIWLLLYFFLGFFFPFCSLSSIELFLLGPGQVGWRGRGRGLWQFFYVCLKVKFV